MEAGTPIMGPSEEAVAVQIFENFCAATTMGKILNLFREMCRVLKLKPTVMPEFYGKLKLKLAKSWRAQAIFRKLDVRSNFKIYNRGRTCSNCRVLIIGGGPCGLRTAIDAQLLGAKVVVVEKRDRMSRNNILHLWPFVIQDLRSLAAKKFFGKFCAGSIDHISIRQLQFILLKVALILGVEFHEGVGFLDILEPKDTGTERCGWKASVEPHDHPVSNYEFDVLIAADGKRNTLQGFKRKEFRGKLAIAITANFINKHTKEEAAVPEISGTAFIFNQKFFLDLNKQFFIDLENLVYYKGETHYFVMTAKKQSLLQRNVLLQDYTETASLLSRDNINYDALRVYAQDAARYATKFELPVMEFAVNHYGQPDVAAFDFTSMFAAENASRVMERHGYKMLVCLVGDGLLEPFWPTGSGCARGFLSALDACWAIRSWSMGLHPLSVIAERESIYRLLGQTTPQHLSPDLSHFTVDPSTRYRNLNKNAVSPQQVVCFFDTDDPTAKLNIDSIEMIPQPHTKKSKRHSQVHPEALLAWLKKQVTVFNLEIEHFGTPFKNGFILCAILHRYRPDLIDLSLLNPENSADNLKIAFDIFENEFGLPSIANIDDILNRDDNTDRITMIIYLSQIYHIFRGEIPFIRHSRLGSPEVERKRVVTPRTSTTRDPNANTTEGPLPVRITAQVVSESENISSQRKSRKRRSSSRYHGQTIVERMQKLREKKYTSEEHRRREIAKFCEMSRLEAKSQKMLESNAKQYPQFNIDDDYNISSYRQNAPIFKERVKELEKLLYPEQERPAVPVPRGTQVTNFTSRVKTIQNQMNDGSSGIVSKKPRDLMRAIGKIEANDWNVKQIEEKIQENQMGRPPAHGKEKVPKWNREQFLARQTKIEHGMERQDSCEGKFHDIDSSLKQLDRQLKEGNVLETGERGKNKVANLAGQFAKKPVDEDTNATKTNNNVKQIKMAAGKLDICHICQKKVYYMEKICPEDSLTFHKSCFKCHYCSLTLKIGSYIYDRDGKYGYNFFCTHHYGMMVKNTKLTEPIIPPETINILGYPVNTSETDAAGPMQLLNRDETPERIEIENQSLDATLSKDICDEIDEDEWSDINFGKSGAGDNDSSANGDDDDSSSSDDEFSAPNEDCQDESDYERISDDSDASDGDEYDNESSYSPSYHEYSTGEDDGASGTEGSEQRVARERRRQEVAIKPPAVTSSHTDTEEGGQNENSADNDQPSASTEHNTGNTDENPNPTPPSPPPPPPLPPPVDVYEFTDDSASNDVVVKSYKDLSKKKSPDDLPKVKVEENKNEKTTKNDRKNTKNVLRKTVLDYFRPKPKSSNTNADPSLDVPSSSRATPSSGTKKDTPKKQSVASARKLSLTGVKTGATFGLSATISRSSLPDKYFPVNTVKGTSATNKSTKNKASKAKNEPEVKYPTCTIELKNPTSRQDDVNDCEVLQKIGKQSNATPNSIGSDEETANSATEVSTDSEFQDDPTPTREHPIRPPNIRVNDEFVCTVRGRYSKQAEDNKKYPHMFNESKLKKKKAANKENKPNEIIKLPERAVANTNNGISKKPGDIQLQFEKIVPYVPKILEPVPRPEYPLNRTRSTSGIAAKKALELKKRYLFSPQTMIGLQKSDSASQLDSKFKTFHSNISECQKLLNPAPDISPSMQAFLENSSKRNGTLLSPTNLSPSPNPLDSFPRMQRLNLYNRVNVNINNGDTSDAKAETLAKETDGKAAATALPNLVVNANSDPLSNETSDKKNSVSNDLKDLVADNKTNAPPKSPDLETSLVVPDIPWKKAANEDLSASDMDSDSLISTGSSTDDKSSKDGIQNINEIPRFELQKPCGEVMELDSLMNVDGSFKSDDETPDTVCNNQINETINIHLAQATTENAKTDDLKSDVSPHSDSGNDITDNDALDWAVDDCSSNRNRKNSMHLSKTSSWENFLNSDYEAGAHVCGKALDSQKPNVLLQDYSDIDFVDAGSEESLIENLTTSKNRQLTENRGFFEFVDIDVGATNVSMIAPRIVDAVNPNCDSLDNDRSMDFIEQGACILNNDIYIKDLPIVEKTVDETPNNERTVSPDPPILKEEICSPLIKLVEPEDNYIINDIKAENVVKSDVVPANNEPKYIVANTNSLEKSKSNKEISTWALKLNDVEVDANVSIEAEEAALPKKSHNSPKTLRKLEEISKEKVKQKNVIHQMVMDKMAATNSEKRLNRRSRSSISPECFGKRSDSNNLSLFVSKNLNEKYNDKITKAPQAKIVVPDIKLSFLNDDLTPDKHCMDGYMKKSIVSNLNGKSKLKYPNNSEAFSLPDLPQAIYQESDSMMPKKINNNDHGNDSSNIKMIIKDGYDISSHSHPTGIVPGFRQLSLDDCSGKLVQDVKSLRKSNASNNDMHNIQSMSSGNLYNSDYGSFSPDGSGKKNKGRDNERRKKFIKTVSDFFKRRESTGQLGNLFGEKKNRPQKVKYRSKSCNNLDFDKRPDQCNAEESAIGSNSDIDAIPPPIPPLPTNIGQFSGESENHNESLMEPHKNSCQLAFERNEKIKKVQYNLKVLEAKEHEKKEQYDEANSLAQKRQSGHSRVVMEQLSNFKRSLRKLQFQKQVETFLLEDLLLEDQYFDLRLKLLKPIQIQSKRDKINKDMMDILLKRQYLANNLNQIKARYYSRESEEDLIHRKKLALALETQNNK